MKLMKHPKNRDIAYKFHGIVKGNWIVDIYNINYAKISGEKPLWIVQNFEIPVERLNPNEMEEIEI